MRKDLFSQEAVLSGVLPAHGTMLSSWVTMWSLTIVVLVCEHYILEKWGELLSKNLILKRKIELFFKDYISLSGIAIGSTWIYVFVVAKTRKYSSYSYGTSWIGNFDISTYREVSTYVTKMQQEPERAFPFSSKLDNSVQHFFPRKADLPYFAFSFGTKKSLCLLKAPVLCLNWI